MTDATDRTSEDRDEHQQVKSRGNSHPATEMGNHLGCSRREVGGVPRGGTDAPGDGSQQRPDTIQQSSEIEEK